jgi:uncharacterized membrane protein YoaK (UPF0700 family)
MIATDNPAVAPAILLAMTSVTGIVDAVSILTLGHVFTANMTGNAVFLGFAIGGAPGVSIPRSLLALACFSIGAVIGGRMTSPMSSGDSVRKTIRALRLEAFLLLVAATASIGFAAPYEGNVLKVEQVLVATALAMGIQNAFARRLGAPDLTTTVLTLTITGLAADSSLAGGSNPRWQRRLAAILAMIAGAAAGALMLRHSVALALYTCAVLATACAFAWMRAESKRRES